MTISTSSSTVTYSGNGATTAFNIPFIGDSASAIQALITNSSGVVTVLSASQYTLVLNPAATGQLWGVGGTVIYPTSGSPLAAGNTITLSRILPLTQTTSISNQGDFYPQAVEQALDLLCMEIQQVSNRTTQYRGVWATNIAYNVGDIVQDGVNGSGTNNFYICALANTSGTWSTDLANGDWSISINTQAIITAMTPISAAMQPVVGATTLASARGYFFAGMTNVVQSDGAGGLTIVNNGVTNAMLAQAPGLTMKGNNTAGTANDIDLAVYQVKAMLGIDTPAITGINSVQAGWLSNTTLFFGYGQMNMQFNIATPFTCSGMASATMNLATNGVNGLDTGSLAANTKYYIYGITTGSEQVGAAVASASATGPAIPSGYYGRSNIIGYFVTDSSAHIMGFTQNGDKWRYKLGSNLTNNVNLAQGAQASWLAVSWASNFPSPLSLVKSICLQLIVGGNSGTIAMCAPNNNYTLTSNTSLVQNDPPMLVGTYPTQNACIVTHDIVPEGSNIYYACPTGSNAFLNSLGFDLNTL